MRTFTTAVIGAGRMGKIHIASMMDSLPTVTIAGVYDIDPSVIEHEALTPYNLHFYRTEREIWEDDDIDTVCICSPTTTHLDYIRKAARAKKHIFCEKPIGEDISEIEKTLETVAENRVNLMIGFNRRFDKNFRRALKAVQAGEIGNPHIVRITSRDPHPPSIEFIKTSGGLFFDMSIHDWDMARFLMGREIETVYAAGSNLVDPAIGEAGDIDTAAAIIRFEGGGIGVIDNSRQAVYGYDQRIEVFGSGGNVVIGNQPVNTATIHGADGIRRDNIPYFFIDRYIDSYRDEVAAFYESLEKKLPSPVSGEDALTAVRAARAAQVSLREGRPVSLVEV